MELLNKHSDSRNARNAAARGKAFLRKTISHHL